ncbi:MAG: type III pantothenate kinase, partial [Mariprofundaceae bacterium]|nr:type III pantothenate kinase [Mariprofundaceae bacterium]
MKNKGIAEKTLLLVDMGNTCMLIGLYRGDALLGRWQLSSQRSLTADELALKLRGLLDSLPEMQGGARLGGVMAASVVPHLDPVLSAACEQVFAMLPAFVGTSGVKTGMAVDYKNP